MTGCEANGIDHVFGPPGNKVATRVIETVTRIRITLARACPDAALYRDLAITLGTAKPSDAHRE